MVNEGTQEGGGVSINDECFTLKAELDGKVEEREDEVKRRKLGESNALPLDQWMVRSLPNQGQAKPRRTRRAKWAESGTWAHAR